MTRDELISIARSNAEIHQLEPELVCAVIEQESDWNQYAIRAEPGFYDRYLAQKVRDAKLCEGEARNRASSYGLMQIMGEVAREFGYNGEFERLLEDPDLNTQFGCKILAHKIAVNQGNLFDGLLAWNGGSNKLYPQQVINRTGHYSTAVTIPVTEPDPQGA